MKQFRTLFPLSVAFSLIYIASGPGPSDRMAGFKVGSILLLALAGLRVDKLLGTALAICSVGNLLLGVRRLGSLDAEKLFLPGLGSFLAAHVIYTAMFRRYKGLDGWKPGPLRIVGIAVIPIVLGLALAISAMLADLGNPLAAIGALFLVTSDALLAISKFQGRFQAGSPLIRITYYIAQPSSCLASSHGVGEFSVRQRTPRPESNRVNRKLQLFMPLQLYPSQFT